MFFNIAKTKHTFARGVSAPDCKDATKAKAIRRLPFPRTLVLPLGQHLGAPARPIVRPGQEVVRGEPIAEPDGFLSVALHAPATGVIDRIGDALDARGETVPAIYLKVYTAASQAVLYGAAVDVEALSPEEIASAVQAAGIVGMGGQGLPTHAKLALPERRKLDTIIANGCESEPYLTTAYRVLLERRKEMLLGLRMALKATGAARAIIAIESTHSDLLDALEDELPKDLPVTIERVAGKYPLGADRVLIKTLLGREVPSGGLPIDIGVAVFNTRTLAQMGELLPQHGGVIEEVITVSGPGVEKPGNYLVALGTPLDFVLKHTGIFPEATQVLFGGPMAGAPVTNREAPVTKGISGVLVLTAEEPYRVNGKTFPCIKCGECIDACPIQLNPAQLHLLGVEGALGAMVEKYHLLDCIECGCCSYVCPSNLPLVQEFRTAKAEARQIKAAS